MRMFFNAMLVLKLGKYKTSKMTFLDYADLLNNVHLHINCSQTLFLLYEKITTFNANDIS